jgi:hypothetical protein
MADPLEELLKDTPMGRMKLLAAWDSLSTETQIRLLAEMSEKGRTRAGDRPIWLKALSSPSEYIRYLAAREVGFPRDDEIKNKVMADASPLVRYSQATGLGLLRNLSNEDFDHYSKEHKLAVVSNDDPPEPRELARWVEHAAESKSVREDELCDVVLEYLCNPEVLQELRESEDDFFGHIEEGFNALWGLLPKVPESVARCLVYRLPYRGVHGRELPHEVLIWLQASPYLTYLLRREDVPLMRLRREVFFSTDPKYDGVKAEAVSAHFHLEPGELHDLFKENSKLLSTLARFSRSLSPVMLLALKDSVGKREGGVTWEDLRFCENHFESALAKLRSGDSDTPYERTHEIRLLRIYRLTKSVMNWSQAEPYLDALPEPLKFLSDKVVNGDIWGTFLAFAKEIANPRFDHLLPFLEDLDLADQSATVATEPKSANDAREKQAAIEVTTSSAKSIQGSSLLGNTIIVLGIVAALLTILFAVSGILDNENRNFRLGVIAMALSAGVIVFAGSQLFRGSK